MWENTADPEKQYGMKKEWLNLNEETGYWTDDFVSQMNLRRYMQPERYLMTLRVLAG